jgi:hypothetical protein
MTACSLGDFDLVGAGRGGLYGHLALRSPTGFLVVSGVGVTGTVRGRTSRLLLGGETVVVVVGAGTRLRVAGRWRAFAAPENGEEGSPRVR